LLGEVGEWFKPADCITAVLKHTAIRFIVLLAKS